MRNILIALFMALCGTQAALADSPGKPRAPVTIAGSVQPAAAVLTLTFDADASDVQVQVYGTDGLQVRGPRGRMANGRFAAGQSTSLDVAYDAPGSGQSNLVVSVSGRFGGKPGTRVQSFSVGDPGPAGKAQQKGRISTNEKGERIVVLPAQRQ